MIILNKVQFNKINFLLGRFITRKCFSSKGKEQIVDIDDQRINYLKIGTGNKHVFLLPGALGSIWSDFKPQIEQLDKSKFSIIAWDPPGYGKSKPPQRKFDNNFYHTDADFAVKLLDKLNVSNCSLLGWSDGGITGLIMAAKYPDKVDALVAWGSNSYVLEKEIQIYQNIRDIKKWSERMRQPMIELYGEEYFQTMWGDWCDTLSDMYKKNSGNICKELLPEIKCPTLIIHGGQDAMVDAEHPVYLSKNIKNAELHVFPNGKHNLHFKYSVEFNNMVTKFLEAQ